MKVVRPFAVALGVVAVGFACERSPVGVPQPPAPTAELVSCSELPYESVTQMIGPEGGIISFGPHALTIPAGALAQSVAITAVLYTSSGPRARLVEAPQGGTSRSGFVGVNAVHFEPRLTFQTPASLTMSYANCNVSGSSLPDLQIVYQPSDMIEEYEPSGTNLAAQSVTGAISHFSNYAVAWRGGDKP